MKTKTSENKSYIHSILHGLLCSFMALVTLFTLNACGGGSPLTLTQENLDKIQRDMSAKEVKSILGEPTESKLEPIPLVGGTKTIFVYSNNQDRIVIVLKNDNVQTKEGHFTNGR